MTCKQKTVLSFHVSPIKRKPKQKHTVTLAVFMLKSNRKAISLWRGLFCRKLQAVSLSQSCKRRIHKQTQSTLSDCTRRSYMLEPHVSESFASRLYNHLSKSAFAHMERRTACHFTETNVQKRIKAKTISSSLLSRAILRHSVPKNKLD